MKNQKFILIKEKSKLSWTIEIVEAISIRRTHKVKRVKSPVTDLRRADLKVGKDIADALTKAREAKSDAVTELRRAENLKQWALGEIKKIVDEANEVSSEAEEILKEVVEFKNLLDSQGSEGNGGEGSEGNSENFGTEDSSESSEGEAVEAKAEEVKSESEEVKSESEEVKSESEEVKSESEEVKSESEEVKSEPSKRKSQILQEEFGWKMGKLEGLRDYAVAALSMLNLEYPELPVLNTLKNMVEFYAAFIEKRRTIKSYMNKNKLGRSWQLNLEDMGKRLVGALRFLVDNAGDSGKVERSEKWIEENLTEEIFMNLDLNKINKSEYLDAYIQKRKG